MVDILQDQKRTERKQGGGGQIKKRRDKILRLHVKWEKTKKENLERERELNALG